MMRVMMTMGFLLATVQSVQAAEPPHWAGIGQQVVESLRHGQQLAAEGKSDDAKEAMIAAYFDIFEELKMEKAERLHLGMKHVTVIEAQFQAVEDAAGDPKQAKTIKPLVDKLAKALMADAAKLDAQHIAEDGVSVK